MPAPCARSVSSLDSGAMSLKGLPSQPSRTIAAVRSNIPHHCVLAIIISLWSEQNNYIMVNEYLRGMKEDMGRFQGQDNPSLSRVLQKPEPFVRMVSHALIDRPHEASTERVVRVCKDERKIGFSTRM